MARAYLKHSIAGILSVGSVVLISGCGGSNAATAPASPPVELHGAGASVPYPLYDRWFERHA